MLLSEILAELRAIGIGVVAKWEFRGKKGIMLGDPQKFFPHPVGPQYPIDCTNSKDPQLTDEEVEAIRRRFNGEQ